MSTNEIALMQDTLTPGEMRHFRSLESRIARGLQTFRDVGLALADIRDNRLHRQSHPTFEAYCRERWDITRDRAYQLMGAAEVVEVLGENGPVNEAQARELVTILHDNPQTVREVWQQVTDSGRPVTAGVIREVAKSHLQPTDPPSPGGSVLTNNLILSIARVGTAYQRWNASRPTRRERTLVSAALRDLTEITGP